MGHDFLHATDTKLLALNGSTDHRRLYSEFQDRLVRDAQCVWQAHLLQAHVQDDPTVLEIVEEGFRRCW